MSQTQLERKELLGPKKAWDSKPPSVMAIVPQEASFVPKVQPKPKQRRFTSIEKYIEAKNSMASVESLIDKHRLQVSMRRQAINKFNSFSINGQKRFLRPAGHTDSPQKLLND